MLIALPDGVKCNFFQRKRFFTWFCNSASHLRDWPSAGLFLSDKFDVVERGGFVAIRRAFDADFVASMQRCDGDSASGTCITAGFLCREERVGRPVVNLAIVHEHSEARSAVILVEVFHVEFVSPGRPTERELGGASLRTQASDALAA